MAPNNIFIMQIMKKGLLNILVFFAFCSCANDNVGFDSDAKKEMMESWAWKIFIFTDEGEFIPNEPVENNFDNSTKVSPIFVEDILEIYSNGDLFMHNEKAAFKDPIVFANFAETERKK